LIFRAAVVFSASMFFVNSMLATTYPLTPEDVREAYFLGRNPEEREAFFSKYVHFPAQPDRGPDVHLIEFRTPYEQVVLKSQENWANYSAQQAQQDYAAHPNEVLVRVSICATQTFSFRTPQSDSRSDQSASWTPKDYLRGFEFRVSQRFPIASQALTVERANLGCAYFDGFVAFLHFRAEQFNPGNVRIVVTRSDGATVETEFNLDQLK
jgi:hypothetical protein